MTREPAVAGLFYPGEAGELSNAIDQLLEAQQTRPGSMPKALIAPHAGYIYSGPVAASAYASLLPHRDRYSRVVLLGPSHRVALSGLATSDAGAFRTPLGDVPLDIELIATLGEQGVAVSEAAHANEHSLEVHLPLLQKVLGPFKLVPLVVGDAAPSEVARVLGMVWGGSETLIVVSSDLSHYHPYHEALAKDRLTCKAIERLDAGRIDQSDACGATPVRGLLIEAKRRAMQVTTLDLRNSGDTAGGKDQVVGYGSWMFC